jgi:hypothetical protein
MSGTIGGLNPSVPQGVLNRVRGSVQWPNFTQLNVTSPYLGADGISLSFEGTATTRLPTMTGQVMSPEPFQPIVLRIHLLRTQGLASQYEQQRQVNSLLGNGVVRTDSSSLPPYNIFNCSIDNVAELGFAGRDAGYIVTIGGYIQTNSSLFGG